MSKSPMTRAPGVPRGSCRLRRVAGSWTESIRAAYIDVRPGHSVRGTIEDKRALVLVDIGPDGTVKGIEVLLSDPRPRPARRGRRKSK